MSWQHALHAILDVAPPSSIGERPSWAVIGSAATALQGCEVVPGDLDLLAVRPEGVYRFAEQMSPYTPARCEYPLGPEHWLSSEEMLVDASPDDWGFFWTFARWQVDGVKVEIAHIVEPDGRPTSKDGAGIWEAGPEIWPHVRSVPFEGRSVTVVPVEVQLETCLRRGLEDRAAAILAVLRRDGYDRALLEKALSRENVRRVQELLTGE